MEKIIIAAIAKNNVIGKNGELPWHYAEDSKRFKELTTGNSVVMGRNTYFSIVNHLGHPLNDRKNIVLTSRSLIAPRGVESYRSMEEALRYCERSGDERVFFIGGQRVFEEALKIADKMHLTHILREYEGDTYFPSVNWSEWRETRSEIKGELRFADYAKISLEENRRLEKFYANFFVEE